MLFSFHEGYSVFLLGEKGGLCVFVHFLIMDRFHLKISVPHNQIILPDSVTFGV